MGLPMLKRAQVSQTDSDGIPDYLEDNTKDMDSDGLPDALDPDSGGGTDLRRASAAPRTLCHRGRAR